MPFRIPRSFLRMIAVSRIATLGAIIVTTSIFAEVLLVIGEILFFESHPYIGIVTYVVFPGIIATGLALIPLGIFLRLRKSREGYSLAAIERIAERRGINVAHVTQVILSLSMVNLVVVALVGYRGFHYTESIAFCGELCHEVMHPEFTTHQRSPHSNVACVQCHIGPGAEWFVRSKLSGTRQLFAVAFNTYSRPIETPVHNLRPAREVCEVCHRPEMFHGNLIKVLEQYAPDEQNTRTYTVLNMKVGGGDAPGREAHGIHWHVSRDHEVHYYATDEKRENVVWVEKIGADGTSHVWTNPDAPADRPSPEEMRTMDCVDCHNRPTHIYLPMDQALNEWMSTDRLDSTIPWLRQLSEQVLAGPYETKDAADAGIARLPDLYREQHPDAWATMQGRVKAMVPVLQELHGTYVYPSMNIQWNTYNSLIGHATSHTQACFRCHNGVLRDADGQSITLDCNACHVVLANREENPDILQRLETR